MVLKRLALILSSLLVIAFSGSALLRSWQEPQFQNSLELYQTNLVLQATAWEPSEQSSQENLQAFRAALLGDNPLENATKQYQEAREATLNNLAKAKKQLAQLRAEPTEIPTVPKPQTEIAPVSASRIQQQKQLQQALTQLQKQLAEVNLNLGILQAQQGKTENAFKTWNQLQQPLKTNPELTETALVLAGLWSDPPRILPDAEQLVQVNLKGWFRYTALTQLYKLQQRQEALAKLQIAQQQAAEQSLLKLALIGTLPILGFIIGVIILLLLVAQRFIQGKASLLAQNADQGWVTPWDGETILQVFVFGFFLMGQVFIPRILIPLILSLLPIPRSVLNINIRIQALYVLVSYLLVASGALSVLYLSLKRFFPLPPDWFRLRLRDNWFLWGFGGYCVALPIVVLVSFINQQLWQGQGGSNPLLQLALESQDTITLAIFFSTAALAAPLFEEFLFRGFLLPSLTRYIPVWGSIVISSFIFAVAHLSLAEILPLFALGVILGVVYTRSRNLLAPMFLHSLWNSGTLLSLFILGSSVE